MPINTAPYHAASNVLAERSSRADTQRGYAKMADGKDGGRLEARLDRFLFPYRAAPQTTT